MEANPMAAFPQAEERAKPESENLVPRLVLDKAKALQQTDARVKGNRHIQESGRSSSSCSSESGRTSTPAPPSLLAEVGESVGLHPRGAFTDGIPHEMGDELCLKHLKLCEVDALLSRSESLHETKRFVCARHHYTTCMEFLVSLLKRLDEGDVVFARDSEPMDPTALFHRMQSAIDKLQYLFLKTHAAASPSTVSPVKSLPLVPVGPSVEVEDDWVMVPRELREKIPNIEKYRRPRNPFTRMPLNVALARVPRLVSQKAHEVGRRMHFMLPRILRDGELHGVHPDVLKQRWTGSQSSRWDIIVMQSFVWETGVQQKHAKFLEEIQADPEDAVLLGGHIDYLLGTKGSALYSCIQAFQNVFHHSIQMRRIEIQTPDKNMERTKWAKGCGDVLETTQKELVEFSDVLTNYAQEKLMGNVDSITAEHLLRAKIGDTLQKRSFPLVWQMYVRLYGPMDEYVKKARSSEAVRAKCLASLPVHCRDGQFQKPARIIDKLATLSYSSAKLSCLADCIQSIHYMLLYKTRADSPSGGALGGKLPSNSMTSTSDEPKEKETAPTVKEIELWRRAVRMSDMPPEFTSEEPVEPPAAGEFNPHHVEESDFSGADDMFPLFVYTLLETTLPNLWSESSYMNDYIADYQTSGQMGYALVVLQAALVYIGQQMDECNGATKK